MPQLVPVFLELALGLGSAGEAPPELGDPSPTGMAHLAIGARPIPQLALGVAGSVARATFDNVLMPPTGVVPDDRMTLTRLGLGLTADGILALGPVELSVGAGGYVFQTTEAAEGTNPLVNISGEYAAVEDTSLGWELEVGIAGRPWRCSRAGLRAVLSEHRPVLSGGEVEVRFVAVELFVQADLAGSPASATGTTTGCGVSSRRGP